MLMLRMTQTTQCVSVLSSSWPLLIKVSLNPRTDCTVYITGRVNNNNNIIICLFRTRGTQYISKDATEQPGAKK